MVFEPKFDLTDLSGPAWVLLEGGSFRMGSDDGPKDTRPARDVRVSPFRMSRFTVTNDQYAAFVRETGRTAPEYWSGTEVPDGQGDHPVTGVSWNDAQMFCGWLTERAGPGEGGAHLPTEAQWEFAARGAQGRLYPWGDEAPSRERANYQESAIEGTAPVGAYPSGATPEGVHGLAGNVRQWCLDWYGPYGSEPEEDPAGPESGTARVLRGGSFVDAPGTLRTSYRFMVDPDSRFGFVGFRIAWRLRG